MACRIATHKPAIFGSDPGSAFGRKPQRVVIQSELEFGGQLAQPLAAALVEAIFVDAHLHNLETNVRLIAPEAEVVLTTVLPSPAARDQT